MRMLPSRPVPKSTGSEIEVFNLLRLIDFDDDAVAFSALNLAEHEYKKWGEIDFVVLSRQGLLVIEVKGGFVSFTEDGIWRYESRGLKAVERSESPLAQASSAYFSLRKQHLNPAIGESAFRRAPSGFCTIFAKTPRSMALGLIGGPEMPSSLVATREDLQTPSTLKAFLQRVLDYWRAHAPGAGGEWDPTETRALGQALRPCFDRVPPLSISAARVRQEQLALTEEQYSILDFAEQTARVLCEGGAGCGKTLLAVECLNRELTKNPLLVTGTESLAAHLRTNAQLNAARILSFGELAEQESDGKFGCLIVDEGQQLTNVSSLRVLDNLLVGGLEGGRWRWFCDPNNQVMSNANFDQKSHAYLQRLSFSGQLATNCRNTPQIVSTVEVLTGADVGVGRMAGQGPDVEFAKGDSPDERLRSAVAIIRRWLQDPAIQLGEIVFLSPRPIELSSAWTIAKHAALPIKKWQPGWDLLPSYPRAMGVSTIEEFRGLEAPFVVLCDMDADVKDLQRWFYLGVTRANFAAAVMADPQCVAASAQAAAATRSQRTAGVPS